MFWVPFSLVNFIAFCIFLGYVKEPWDEGALKVCFWVTLMGPLAWVVAAVIGLGYAGSFLGRRLHGIGKWFREGSWKSYRLFGRTKQRA